MSYWYSVCKKCNAHFNKKPMGGGGNLNPAPIHGQTCPDCQRQEEAFANQRRNQAFENQAPREREAEVVVKGRAIWFLIGAVAGGIFGFSNSGAEGAIGIGLSAGVLTAILARLLTKLLLIAIVIGIIGGIYILLKNVEPNKESVSDEKIRSEKINIVESKDKSVLKDGKQFKNPEYKWLSPREILITHEAGSYTAHKNELTESALKKAEATKPAEFNSPSINEQRQ